MTALAQNFHEFLRKQLNQPHNINVNLVSPDYSASINVLKFVGRMPYLDYTGPVSDYIKRILLDFYTFDDVPQKWRIGAGDPSENMRVLRRDRFGVVVEIDSTWLSPGSAGAILLLEAMLNEFPLHWEIPFTVDTIYADGRSVVSRYWIEGPGPHVTSLEDRRRWDKASSLRRSWVTTVSGLGSGVANPLGGRKKKRSASKSKRRSITKK